MKFTNTIVSTLDEYKYYIFVLLGIFVISAFYAYGTRFEKTIRVKETNSLRSKYGKNTVADYEGNVYSVSNSIFYGFFSSIELYTKFDADKNYKITGYGYRIPILGLFPNIVTATQV